MDTPTIIGQRFEEKVVEEEQLGFSQEANIANEENWGSRVETLVIGLKGKLHFDPQNPNHYSTPSYLYLSTSGPKFSKNLHANPSDFCISGV